MREFISSYITCSILEQTHLIFGTVKEGILEILDECLGDFCTKMMTIRTPWVPKFCPYHTPKG